MTMSFDVDCFVVRTFDDFARGYLRFAGDFHVNGRQLAVNERQCFLCGLWCAMSVNGLATAQLWKWSLMACFARCGWTLAQRKTICAKRKHE